MEKLSADWMEEEWMGECMPPKAWKSIDLLTTKIRTTKTSAFYQHSARIYRNQIGRTDLNQTHVPDTLVGRNSVQQKHIIQG
jgi:hypothetical protein